MAEQTGVLKTLSDPNVINLLAGIAARLDPEGVGGALGGAATQMVQARSAQKALAGQEQQRKGQNLLALSANMPEGPEKDSLRQMAMQYLGGRGGKDILDMTPKGEPGLTSVTRTPTGYKLDLDVPTPGVGPTQVVPSTTAAPVGATTKTATSKRQLNISDYVPFY